MLHRSCFVYKKLLVYRRKEPERSSMGRCSEYLVHLLTKNFKNDVNNLHKVINVSAFRITGIT